jgi:hypothetical protein
VYSYFNIFRFFVSFVNFPISKFTKNNKTKNEKSIVIIILICMSIYSFAQEFSGDWKGTIEVQGTKVELIFHITNADGVLATTLDVPMQGASGIPLDKTTSNDNEITISSSKNGYYLPRKTRK